jgi:hypothetical protein
LVRGIWCGLGWLIIIEFIAGHSTLPDEEHVTLDLNLAELYYVILRNAGSAEAKRCFDRVDEAL